MTNWTAVQESDETTQLHCASVCELRCFVAILEKSRPLQLGPTVAGAVGAVRSSATRCRWRGNNEAGKAPRGRPVSAPAPLGRRLGRPRYRRWG